MHHVVLDKWSRGDSLLHQRDPRGKVLGLLAFLVIIATTPPTSYRAFVGYVVFLLIAIGITRLPLGGVLTRAAVVLPFSAAFAVISLIEGDGIRALSLIEKSYLSAVAVVIIAGSTPMPSLLRGLEFFGVPRFFLLVVQFLYRYLFVISEQAQHMRVAAGARGALSARALFRHWRFRVAAGAVAVLFLRSYTRAAGIYRAMMARGFQGHIPLLATLRFSWSDLGFLVVAVAVPATLRFGLGA